MIDIKLLDFHTCSCLQFQISITVDNNSNFSQRIISKKENKKFAKNAKIKFN